MDRKMRINVLVPDELEYIIDPDTDPDADPIFIAVKEKGQLLIKPLTNYLTGNTSTPIAEDYRNGFMNGVVDGYEDGYHRGFNDGSSHHSYDSRYKGKSWLSEEDEYDQSHCSGNCTNCKYYDDIFEVCRFEGFEMNS